MTPRREATADGPTPVAEAGVTAAVCCDVASVFDLDAVAAAVVAAAVVVLYVATTAVTTYAAARRRVSAAELVNRTERALQHQVIVLSRFGNVDVSLRRVDELRVEVEVKDSFKKKLVRNRLKWAGIVERMGDDHICKEIRYLESGGENEARKTENATGGLR